MDHLWMKNITEILIGIGLMALGIFLMTKLHRKQSATQSVISSILEFLLDTTIGLFNSGCIAGVESIAVLMVLIGFFMTLFNILQLIGIGHFTSLFGR